MPNKQPQKISIFAILSLIFAFLFFPLVLLFLPTIIGYLVFLLFPIIILILGITALFQIKRNPSLKGRGLAIAGIIITIFIFLISYYGIFATTPQMKRPYCGGFPMGFYCNGFSVVPGNPGYITLKIESGMGKGIMIREINITSSTNETNCYIDLTKELPGGPETYNNLNGWHLLSGEKETVKIICNIKSSEKKKNMIISIPYCEDISNNNEKCEQFLHTMEGEIVN